MLCQICQKETRVLSTRDGKRRRECPQRHRFTTMEVVIVQHVDAEHLEQVKQARRAEISSYFSRGMKVEDVADRFNVHVRTAKRWKKQFTD